MPVAAFDSDFKQADAVIAQSNVGYLRDLMAFAIAAERERCATIAESFKPVFCGDDADASTHTLAESIAAAIRNKE